MMTATVAGMLVAGLAACGATGSGPSSQSAAQQQTASTSSGAPSPTDSLRASSASSAPSAAPQSSAAARQTPSQSPKSSPRSPTPKPTTSAAHGTLSWPSGYPKPCPANAQTPGHGQFLEALLMDPNQSAYQGTVSGDGYCFWYKMGDINWSAKTVQLLVADGKTGESKLFSGGIGASTTVGRFNLRIVAPMGMWPQSHDTFDVAIYGV